jgi:hypothetical protein
LRSKLLIVSNLRALSGVKEMGRLAEGEGMMRSVRAVAAGLLLSVVVGGCGSGPGSPHHVRVARCRARALMLQPGTAVVPMTGEHAVLYALTNRSRVTCAVRGYPQVALYDADGAVLPFRYAAGGGMYVTARKPVTVVLDGGASAFVLVAKYRCDLGIARGAATIRLTLPAAGRGMFVGREAVGLSGPARLSYCRGGGHDPGQVVTISPVEPTRQATSSLH